MAKSKKTKISVGDVIAQFENHAIAHRELLGNGDVRGSNRAHDKLMKLSAKIRTMEDEGKYILEELVVSKQEAVRCIAAYLLLPIDPKRASQELQNLSKNAANVFLSGSARVTLEEWEAGRLDTDWFIKKYGPMHSSRLN